MTKIHDARCRCSICRHERFRPGPPSGAHERGRRTPAGAARAVNFYGHFTYHPPSRRATAAERPVLGAASYQASGPISFGPPDFVRGAVSTNKFLAAPAPTIRRAARSGP